MCNFLGRALDAQRFFHDVTYESSKDTWAIGVYAVLPEERLDQSNFRNNTPSNTNIWATPIKIKSPTVDPNTTFSAPRVGFMKSPLVWLVVAAHSKTRVVPCKISKEGFAEGRLSTLSAPRPQPQQPFALALDPAAANGFVTVIVDTIIAAVISLVVALFGIKLFHIYERYAFIPQILGQKLPKNRGYLKKGGHEFRVTPEMWHLYSAGGGRDLHKPIRGGAGCQQAFYDDPNVLYISLHVHMNGTFYPSGNEGDMDHCGIDAGEGKNVNIPWPSKGMGGGDYMYAFQNVVMPIANEFDPDFVIIAGSFDAAADDELQITALYGP
ncbi:uncharacterized protein PV07_08656 [Cladophialophora immunda]|uniref:histone deacetylase n=1 Tax=Cladophialophora immunda TaxID=569365 RepID=A0A0D2C4X3_9EURO|nr:uncharacterized protein PV07_08656 [Cladophialophora immunda]KIW25490.1 hypothetical protein PV07_08656 [Cladophialophora immunda]